MTARAQVGDARELGIAERNGDPRHAGRLRRRWQTSRKLGLVLGLGLLLPMALADLSGQDAPPAFAMHAAPRSLPAIGALTVAFTVSYTLFSEWLNRSRPADRC